MATVKGYVFDIQRFSIHDGPGIRTTVFLKGCSLHCFWCQNPEGIYLRPEIMYYPDRCINCGNCVLVCRQNAHLMKDGVHQFVRERCNSCGKCTEVCYAGTLQLAGRKLSVKEVVEEVLKDKKFYDISGGGVTLSGGDVVVQHRFTNAMLGRCKKEGLHTAIETAANCRWMILEDLLPLLDLIMMDIKLIDSRRHKEATSASNRNILRNAQKLSETGNPLIIRTPIIPNVNDNVEDISAIAEFIHAFPNLLYYELLPFHRLGEGKYRSLGIDYPASQLKTPSNEKMIELAKAAREFGINVRI